MDFLEIEKERRQVAADVFANASGAVNPDLPKQTFTMSFGDEVETKRVIVVVDYKSVEVLRKVVEMDMEQGVTMAQDQFGELLERTG